MKFQALVLLCLVVAQVIYGFPTPNGENDYEDYEHSIGVTRCAHGYTYTSFGCEEIVTVEIEPTTMSWEW